MNDILVIIGFILVIIGVLNIIPILVLISILFIIPKLICIIASVKNTVYNDEEDDL